MNNKEYEMIRSFLRFMDRVRADRMETWSPMLKKVNKIDLHILLMVQTMSDIRIGDIKDKLDIPGSTLTSIINRMEKKKLLERVTTTDKRSYSLRLLEEGKRIRRIHDQVLKKIAGYMLGALTPTEQKQFIGLLNKVASNLPQKEP
jgi:DNA-binding MarR family transcriptional regulator